jgi:hypothetical protein
MFWTVKRKTVSHGLTIRRDSGDRWEHPSEPLRQLLTKTGTLVIVGSEEGGPWLGVFLVLAENPTSIMNRHFRHYE